MEEIFHEKSEMLFKIIWSEHFCNTSCVHSWCKIFLIYLRSLHDFNMHLEDNQWAARIKRISHFFWVTSHMTRKKTILNICLTECYKHLTSKLPVYGCIYYTMVKIYKHSWTYAAKSICFICYFVLNLLLYRI